MIEFHTALVLFVIALIIGAIGGGIFYKYSLREFIGFAVKIPDGREWYKITVIRENNRYHVFADGELILTKKPNSNGNNKN